MTCRKKRGGARKEKEKTLQANTDEYNWKEKKSHKTRWGEGRERDEKRGEGSGSSTIRFVLEKKGGKVDLVSFALDEGRGRGGQRKRGGWLKRILPRSRGARGEKGGIRLYLANEKKERQKGEESAATEVASKRRGENSKVNFWKTKGKSAIYYPELRSRGPKKEREALEQKGGGDLLIPGTSGGGDTISIK